MMFSFCYGFGLLEMSCHHYDLILLNSSLLLGTMATLKQSHSLHTSKTMGTTSVSCLFCFKEYLYVCLWGEEAWEVIVTIDSWYVKIICNILLLCKLSWLEIQVNTVSHWFRRTYFASGWKRERESNFSSSIISYFRFLFSNSKICRRDNFLFFSSPFSHRLLPHTHTHMLMLMLFYFNFDFVFVSRFILFGKR